MLSFKMAGESRLKGGVAVVLLVGLLFLRFPLVIGRAYDVFLIPSKWIVPVFQSGTYVMTAILIWLERKRLKDFNIASEHF
ncbi:hypothetical protein [Desulfosporosinus sp. FKA]|uniref:hypothetical protein n=1 Tax=Desulfosporosinus sp. FKA TaxID=1969834 RepID=UPI000B49D8DA|nr:hypothetical protein [Desulfosporosinus sp. FKA]